MRAEARRRARAQSRDGIPSTLLFRTGGDTTVRGYAFESLGVQDGDAIVAGPLLRRGSVEATRWIDAVLGHRRVRRRRQCVRLAVATSHLALGYGVGARVRTPIGPFRLDVAYGQESQQVRVHFSVGLAF